MNYFKNYKSMLFICTVIMRTKLDIKQGYNLSSVLKKKLSIVCQTMMFDFTTH